MTTLNCFKAYDVRGKLGEELNEEIAYKIGRAFAEYLNAKTIVIGCDMRTSSESLKQATIQGIIDHGCDVIDIGMTGTEEVYFATFHLGVDGGIEITASHNPINYNGIKFVGKGSTPISGDKGLPEIKALAEANKFNTPNSLGKTTKKSILTDYTAHLLDYIDLTAIKPMRIVVNSGNGAAGHVIDSIEQAFKQEKVPVDFIKIHHQPDGTFPNGIPNPILLENQKVTSDAVTENKADFGVAWDGDFDRCFLFDENGSFIEGYYIVGLLAQAFLAQNSADTVIYDPRLIWNTLDIVASSGGRAVQSKAGHAFIKQKMRNENAVYGGEMSAHHYFKNFAFCDSGMIPWLLIAELLSKLDKNLSSLVEERISKFPCSGEINYQVKDTSSVLETIKQSYQQKALSVDTTDGLGFDFEDWRFNIRPSNTEPLIRLNIEAKANPNLVAQKLQEIESLIK